MEGRHFVNPFADALHDMIEFDLTEKMRNRLEWRKKVADNGFEKPCALASVSSSSQKAEETQTEKPLPEPGIIFTFDQKYQKSVFS